MEHVMIRKQQELYSNPISLTFNAFGLSWAIISYSFRG